MSMELLDRLGYFDSGLASKLQKLKCFIILATQRTGSTLVSSDFSNTGKFGNISEYVILLMNENKNQIMLDADEFIKRGINDNGDIFSIKIMQNQLIYLGAYACSPQQYDSHKKESQNTARKLQEISLKTLTKNESYHIIYLRRQNIFDQAYSHVRAMHEKFFHLHAEKDYQEHKLIHADPKSIHNNISTIINQNEIIKKILKKNNLKYRELYYDDVVTKFPEYMVESLKHFNFDVNFTGSETRKYKKIIPESDVLANWSNYVNFLRGQ